MKYIASWSGGKDSTASIILAHEHGEPLDLIIFSEVMFDNEISGELPEHIDFIKNKAIPVFESWDIRQRFFIPTEHMLIVFSGKQQKGNFMDLGNGQDFP